MKKILLILIVILTLSGPALAQSKKQNPSWNELCSKRLLENWKQQLFHHKMRAKINRTQIGYENKIFVLRRNRKRVINSNNFGYGLKKNLNL